MTRLDIAAPIVSLAEAQAFVRVETGDEEALLAGLVRTASAICEAFLNQVVIVRPFAETLTSDGSWQKLRHHPVRSITQVTVAGQPLPSEQFALEIDENGQGRVSLAAGAIATVSGEAGMALDPNEVPEPIRQGVIRLTAFLHANRDSADGDIPAIVTALWKPYRRLVLS